MPWFERDGVKVWAGTHRTMGVLVFDPRSQFGVPSDRVRLYIIAQRRMAKFAAAIVREGVTATPGDSAGADAYFDMRGRFTHCYGCQRDLNSIDFRLCDACGMWRTCGARCAMRWARWRKRVRNATRSASGCKDACNSPELWKVCIHDCAHALVRTSVAVR